MICCVCGNEDKTYTAYCPNCSRVPHRIMTDKEHKKFKKFLDSLNKNGK